MYVNDEHAAEAEHGHQQREPHLRLLQHAHFLAEADRPAVVAVRHQRGDAAERQHAEGGDDPERRAPAEQLADEGAERHAEHVRQRGVNISAIALARLSAGTSDAATTAPIPKNDPCANDVTTRATISIA